MGQAARRMLGVNAGGVGPELDPGLAAQLELDVILVHHEVDGADPLALQETIKSMPAESSQCLP